MSTFTDSKYTGTEILIKFILAVLFLLCLFDMPYGFYQLVRFIALVGFSILSYFNFNRDNKVKAWTFIALAILFQPLLKISLGRTLWNIVDVIVALWLIFLLVQNFRSPK